MFIFSLLMRVFQKKNLKVWKEELNYALSQRLYFMFIGEYSNDRFKGLSRNSNRETKERNK